MSINKTQKKILNKIKCLFIANKNKYLKNIIDNKYYLNNWAEGIGQDYLNLIIGFKKLIPRIIIKKVILNLLEIITNYGVKNTKISNRDYKYICVSWALKNDFSIKGEFHDRYTNTSSRTCPNTIWILLNLEKDVPNIIDENIILITKKYSFKLIFFQFFTFLINFLFNKKDEDGIRISNSGYKKYKVVKDNILKIIEDNNIKLIFTSYEAQPYQIGFNAFINKNFKNILTVGYIHSCLPSFPTEYIYRYGSPKKLITHGKNQKKILSEKLNWNINNIKNINTLRYQNTEPLPDNCIYLPYCIGSRDKILIQFKILFNEISYLFDRRWSIRNHPIMNNSIPHIKLIKDLKNIISKKEIFSNKKILSTNNVIAIGSSAVVIELIELGYTVFHISINPVFDIYSPFFWKGIRIKKINQYIFKYKIDKKGLFIQKGKKQKSLYEVLEDIR